MFRLHEEFYLRRNNKLNKSQVYEFEFIFNKQSTENIQIFCSSHRFFGTSTN